MMDLRASGPKKNHKKGIAAATQDRKRAEAKVRQDEYSGLTIQQRIDRLDQGGYRALKERARLNALLATTSGLQSKS